MLVKMYDVDKNFEIYFKGNPRSLKQNSAKGAYAVTMAEKTVSVFFNLCGLVFPSKVNYTEQRLKFCVTTVLLMIQLISRLAVCWSWMKMENPDVENIPMRSWNIIRILLTPIYIFVTVLTFWLFRNSKEHSKLLDSVRVVFRSSKEEQRLVWKFNFLVLTLAVSSFVQCLFTIVTESIQNMLNF